VDTLEVPTLVEESKAKEEPKSIGLIGNAADIFPELVLRGIIPDVVTDQTPAHDYLFYIPHGLSLEEVNQLRAENPGEFACKSAGSMARHVEAMLEFQKRGAEVFDYGNNLRSASMQA
jgi:urocanate hydratase